MAWFDTAEQDDSGKGVHQHEQEHASYDKERLEERHDNGQHEHLECRVFARNGKKPQHNNDQTERVACFFELELAKRNEMHDDPNET